MRTIYLHALQRDVSLRAYVKAVKIAKDNPEVEFKTGLTTWWPTKGSEVMRQFRRGMHDRINQMIPYVERGIK